MTLLELISAGFVCVGFSFFLAGVVGLLRFPDVFTRLHAVTKADNVGLGFIVVGLSVSASDVFEVLELFAIWFLVMAASTTAAHLISRTALAEGLEPWEGES